MNIIWNYIRLCMACLTLVLLAACAQDDKVVFDSIVGHTWVGDLGFSDRYGDPLESGLNFDSNGFGVDDQCYFDDPHGHIVYSLPFRWRIENNILSLDYGNEYPLLEICDVYVAHGEINGMLYVDGYREGSVTLYRY